MDTKDYIRGVVIFYINVGQMEPPKAEAYVERIKGQLDFSRWPPYYQRIFIPVRGEDTRTELIEFSLMEGIVDGESWKLE